MEWKLIPTEYKLKFKPKSAILIEGLPGIGNVGKIAVDYLIDKLEAQNLYDLYSQYMPNYVMIEEDNTAYLPKMSIYHQKINETDYFFLVGDFQPENPEGVFKLCECITEFCQKNNINKVITTGGIGLEATPEKQKLYVTGNSTEFIEEFKSSTISNKIYNVVGPIIGVSGILLGTTKHQNINAISLLVQTIADPYSLDYLGAKKILRAIDKKYELNLNYRKLNKLVKEHDEESEHDLKELKKLKTGKQETNYIG